MVHWKTLVSNSETISAADLEGLDAAKRTATITAVEGGAFESEGGKVDRKALVSFAHREKKLAANVINCTLLAALFGDEVEGWIGHAVTLMADKVEVAGQYKGDPCVRIEGSPELKGNVTVQVKLPRRKPIERVLVPTGKAVSQNGPVSQTGNGQLLGNTEDDF